MGCGASSQKDSPPESRSRERRGSEGARGTGGGNRSSKRKELLHSDSILGSKEVRSSFTVHDRKKSEATSEARSGSASLSAHESDKTAAAEQA